MERDLDREWHAVREIIERDKAAGLAELDAAPKPIPLPRYHPALRAVAGLAAAALLVVILTRVGPPRPGPVPGPAPAADGLTLANLPLFQATEDSAAEEAMPTPDPAWRKSLANLLEKQQIAPPAPAPGTEVERGDPRQTGERIARAIGEGEVGRFIRQFRQFNQEV